MQKHVIVVIPNWNGASDLPAAIDSILTQTYKKFALVVVDNGSTDNSKEIIEAYERKDARVRSVYRDKNYGYTGGVNPGMELAIAENAAFVAPFNNDAVAEKDWLGHLVRFLENNSRYGITTCTLVGADGKTIDTTAEEYTTWGLPYPRGRGEPLSALETFGADIFGASGGASLYRVAMLKQIGLLDQDFFAYYEDIDLSFRAQLDGWKVAFVPQSRVRHEQGKTSARIAGRESTDRSTTPFITEQFMKNVPFVLIKNIPLGLMPRVLPRFMLAYTLLFFRAVADGRGGAAFKGALIFWLKLPKKLAQRRRIQKHRKVSNTQLWNMLVHDLPPNAHKLRRLRSFWRKTP